VLDRSSTGGLQPGFPETLSKAQDALGSSQSVGHSVAQQEGDEVQASRAHIPGPVQTPLGRFLEVGDLLRRIVLFQGPEGARSFRTGVQSHQLPLVIDLHESLPDSEMKFLPHVMEGRRVVAALEVDMAI
jgi:hypothetical protein